MFPKKTFLSSNCFTRKSFRIFSLLAICLAAQLNYGQSTETSKTADATVLELGKTTEREIAGGQKDVYKITLAERQYANILVEQIGIDLSVRVIDAGGKLLIQFDSDISTRGTETIEYAASSANAFTLEVEPKPKDAPVARYKIVLSEIRSATEDDFSLQEARLLLAETVRLSREGKLKDALPLAERVLAIREKILGSENALTAIALNRLGIIHFSLGDNAKSETYLGKALGIYEKMSGANNLNAADTLGNLAILYRFKGDFAAAEKMMLRSIEIRQRELGSEHSLIASNFNNLGIIYRRRGDNAKAQQMYERSLEIRERLYGADSIEVANTLINLAAFYYFKGDYQAALKIDERVLAIREKKLPPEHFDIGHALNNLALVHADLGDLEKAEPLYLRATTIYEKNFGPENVQIITPLGNLAKLYAARGDFEKADALFRRVLKIAETTWGGDDLQLAELFVRAGNFYTLKADYETAETLLTRALAIREKTLGVEHFEVGRTCSSLARLYLRKGEAARAIPLQECANRVGEKNMVLNLVTGTEHEKLSYMSLLAEDLNQTINLQIALPENKFALEQAATTLLQRKGRVLDQMANNLMDLRRRFDRLDQSLLQKLNDTIAALAEITLNKPARLTLEDYQKQIAALEDQKDKFESEISRRSGGFFEQPKSVSLAEVRASIPKNAALIEFSLYHAPDKTTGGKTIKGESGYVVYVIRNEGEIGAAKLDSAAEIDRAVDAYRQALRDPKRKDVQQPANAVYEKLIKPIQTFLGDAAHLLVSPDGNLNLIPFEALADGKNQYLIERYSFTYLSGGRDLLRMKTTRESKSRFLVIANPLFGELAAENTNKTTAIKTALRNKNRRSAIATRNLSDTYFAPLGGTLQEARLIQTLFPEAIFLSGSQSTESALKQTIAPRILHIATHGFFLENAEKSNSSVSSNVKTENPLLRSGLALAGANQRKDGGSNDGILTALEASGLNLWGTKLVVLSACDTGLGEVRNGEGVYGLRRAFVLAGTESIVMSLWSISDYVTRELMANYYKNLKQGTGRGAALRQVQLEMLKKSERRHPFFWAGFIQSGEWANLDGKR